MTKPQSNNNTQNNKKIPKTNLKITYHLSDKGVWKQKKTWEPAQ